MGPAKLNTLEEAREEDPPEHLHTSSRRFNMEELTQSLKEIPSPNAPEYPANYLSREVDFNIAEEDDDDKKTEGPSTRRKARESIDGVDTKQAIRRLARCQDRSYDYLVQGINNMQHANLTRIERIEHQNQQILAVVQDLSDRIPKSVDVPILHQTQSAPAYQPPQRRAGNDFSEHGLGFHTHSRIPQDFNDMHDRIPQNFNDDEDRRPRGQRGGKHQHQHQHQHQYGRDRSFSRAPPFAPPIPPKPPSLQDEPSSFRNTEFKAQEIGYFYLGLSISKDYPDRLFLNISKDLIYRNIYMFV